MYECIDPTLGAMLESYGGVLEHRFFMDLLSPRKEWERGQGARCWSISEQSADHTFTFARQEPTEFGLTSMMLQLGLC